MDSRRREPRTRSKFFVNISGREFEELGVTVDLSDLGLGVLTPQCMPVDSDVSILVAAGENIVALRGEIRWCRSAIASIRTNHSYQVGIRLVEAPPAYIELVDLLARRTAQSPVS